MKKRKIYFEVLFLNNRCYDDLYSVNGVNVVVTNFLKSKVKSYIFSFNLF